MLYLITLAPLTPPLKLFNPPSKAAFLDLSFLEEAGALKLLKMLMAISVYCF